MQLDDRIAMILCKREAGRSSSAIKEIDRLAAIQFPQGFST